MKEVLAKLTRACRKCARVFVGQHEAPPVVHHEIARSHAHNVVAATKEAQLHVDAPAVAPVPVIEEPLLTFADFPFGEKLLADIRAAGFVNPTPIQAQCIAPVLEGRDVLGLAQTGTGKTAAFALPIIQRLAGHAEMGALVLAPTRELAMQITGVFQQLGKAAGIGVAMVVGGIPIKEDYKALGAWPNVLVATPGRLLDHIRSGTVVLNDVQTLAVDEADRMYDMGFIPQVAEIIQHLPEKRQTLMFTATMPAEVEALVRQNMNDPVRVQVGVTAPAARAEQRLLHLREDEKMGRLLELLGAAEGRVLVFVRTKRKVETVARQVGRRHRVAHLHGDREQVQRDAAMNGFREGKYRILIATDIAARGLDVADIEHVINFDFPMHPEDYIHRIGRTARVAASGLATSFLTHEDMPCLRQLQKLIPGKVPDAHGAPAAPAERDASKRRRRSSSSNTGGGGSTGGSTGGTRRRSRGGRSRSKPQTP